MHQHPTTTTPPPQHPPGATPLTAAGGGAWRTWAACRDTSPELFFDVFGEPEADRRRRHQVAKGLCGRCPVRQPCLAEVLTLEGAQTFGVRGGLTARERRRLLATGPGDGAR